MQIKKALILSKDPKTDDELKAIMATHPAPWVHGFYKSTLHDKWWEACLHTSASGIDAIWIEEGFTFDHGDKWLVESFHVPDLFCRPLSADPFGPYERRKDQLEEAWWSANVALIFHQIPESYHAYGVYYGEREDEWGGPDCSELPEPEPAWRESLLEYFDYAPEVKAALGIAEAEVS
ncbi:hypothetical protein Q2941_32485 [Bradyrhizobium sp. UFLA05-153]